MTGYNDIARDMRKKIQTGSLSPGDEVPTYAQITETYKVNRTTAIRAYDLLVKEGYIARRHSKAAVVTARPAITVTGAQRADRIDAGGPDYTHGETATNRSLTLRSCADPMIAAALGIAPHDEIVLRRRVFNLNDRPNVVAITVIHMRVVADVPEILESGPLGDWRVLYEERTGKRIYRSKELRGARHATDEELTELGFTAPPGSAVPVLVTQTTFHTEDGPVMVMEDVYRPGTWQEGA